MQRTNEKPQAPSAPNGLKLQSYAGALRERLVDIERAVQEGARHETIRLDIGQQGYNAPIGTFRKSLSRARMWWRRHLLLQVAQHALQEVERIVQDHQVSVELAAALRAQTGANRSKGEGDGVPAQRVAPPQANPLVPVPNGRPQRVELDKFFVPKSVFKK